MSERRFQRRDGGRLGLLGLVAALALAMRPGAAQLTRPPALAPPVHVDGWIAPSPDRDAMPVWGVEDGIRIGLWPAGGPRGLIRVYAPYACGRAGVREPLINFIAVEPIVGAARGYSEMETSQLDGSRGLRMWTGSGLEAGQEPGLPWRPPKPTYTEVDGVEAMTFYVFTETFRNGARPITRVVLRKDRPREVTFETLSGKGGRPMNACVLTATMGNYARLRRLWLGGETVEAKDLWPRFAEEKPLRTDFAPGRQFPLGRLAVVDGQVLVAATPDETDPERATYPKGLNRFWRYHGKVATQYWRAAPSPGLKAKVNARVTYWASRSLIPGGVSFENFELVAPFESGQSFTFGVTLQTPEQLGFGVR